MGDDLDKAVEQGDDVGNVEEVAPGPPPRRVRTEEHGDAAVQTTPDAPDPVVHPPLRRGATLGVAKKEGAAVAAPARTTGAAAPARRVVSFDFAPADMGQRTIIYGGAGVGKTTLADLAPGPVVSIDLDDSLPALQPLHTQRVAGVETWEDLHEVLLGDGWDGVGSVVLDSATKAEEMCLRYVLKTVPTGSGGGKASSLESYSYGKGVAYLAEAWLPLLADLDAHVRAGRHVLVICHECKEVVPNPSGVDFLRFAPRLSSPKNDNNSIRLRTIEWSDHCLWLHADESISAEGGKGTGRATGSGTRTLYPVGMPWYIAKSRCLHEPMEIKPGDDSVWQKMFGEPATAE